MEKTVSMYLTVVNHSVILCGFRVQQYQTKFRSYKLDHLHLNSCGNSECSDEDDSDTREVSLVRGSFQLPCSPCHHLLPCGLLLQDLSPTSVFKVYNSSEDLGDPGSPFLLQKRPDIFTWASAQQMQHDHSYCHEETSPEPQHTTIDHGTVVVANIQWCVHSLSLVSCCTRFTMCRASN